MGNEVDFETLLKELNLPHDIFQVLDELPDELRGYIVDEIIEEALNRKIAHDEVSRIDNDKVKQENVRKAIVKRRKETAIDNQ
jgi:hypothetical protein